MTSKEFAKLTRAEQVARFEAYKKAAQDRPPEPLTAKSPMLHKPLAPPFYFFIYSLSREIGGFQNEVHRYQP